MCKFGSSKRFDHRLCIRQFNVENFQRMVGPGTYDSKGKKEGSQNVVFTHARKKTFVVDEI